MTPDARVAAAIALLDAFDAPEERRMMDALLADWARGARYAGAKDRAAVADLVYGALRRWRSAAAPLGPSGRARLLTLLSAHGAELDLLFSGGRFGPPPVTDAERAALAAKAPEARDWPDWLADELARSVPDPAAEIRAQRDRAPVDLRVNRLRADPEAAAVRLAAEGVATEPSPVAPAGLRLSEPARADRTESYADGWVEIQDAASQAVAHLAAALAPEEGVLLDACAGGGGKTLALAAERPRARLLAHDVAPARLRDLPARARRAGARVEILSTATLARWSAAADLALVDAPCSGSGAWARNPDAKWRLSPERFEALQTAQSEALELGARAVRPGGALVYATCSLLAAENERARARFLERTAEFEPIDLAPVWRRAALRGDPGLEILRPAAGDAPDGALRLSPARTRTDGFFVAAFRRRG